MDATLPADSGGSPGSLVFLLGVLLLIDSLHFVFARMLLPYAAPSVSAMYVLTVATVEMAAYGLLRRDLHLGSLRRHLWIFLAIGFLIAVSTNLNYEAVAFIDPGTAALLGKSSIVFSLAFGLFWLRERFSPLSIGGAFLAIAGAVVIAYQPAEFLRFGSILIIVSTFMYALHTALVKRYCGGIRFVDFFFYRLLCTSAFLFLFTMGRHTLMWPGAPTWGLLIMVGTVDVVISRTLFYVSLQRLPMSVHTVILTISPVVAVIWSLIFFDVTPTWAQMVGGGAVLLGVALVARRRS